MANFIVNTGSEITPIQHSKNIFHQYLSQCWLSTLFGKKGSGKPIIVDDTLKGQAGDKIRYHFIPQNDTDGIEGQNASVTGNEDDLSEYYMDLLIDQHRKSFRRKGKMTEQRIIWSSREEMKTQSTNWWEQRTERWLIWALTGWVDGMVQTGGALLPTTATIESSSSTTDLVNGAGRCIRANGPADSALVTEANSDNTAVYAAMATTDKVGTRLLEDASLCAKFSGTYRVRPIKVGPNREEFFILLVHPYVGRDLRNTAEWQNRALSCSDRGLDGDPIATGALGVWNNIIVKEHDRIVRFGIDGTKMIARNLLLGADAAVLGWAQKLDWVEELLEAGNEFRVTTDEIRGQTKVKFGTSTSTDVDIGVVQVCTAADA